jgi:Xaa-Pro aminopeptidase
MTISERDGFDSASATEGAKYRREAAAQLIIDSGAGAALISDPATLRWLGLSATYEAYVLSRDRTVLEVASRGEGEPRRSLERALAACGIRSIDHILVDGVGARRLAGEGPANCSDAFLRARRRKYPDELQLLRHAADLVAIGHAALRRAVHPGVTEQELWATASAVIDQANPASGATHVDLMVGPRTALVGEPPGDAQVRDGDAVLFDLAVERSSYWADSCTTFTCGHPSPELRKRHKIVRATLDRASHLARSGVRARDLDKAIRDTLERAGLSCPHHTGHGVGLAAQEAPWLVPDSEDILEEGMVIALEPGAYTDGFGVRLEHLYLVDPDQARQLTTHSLDLT